MMQLTFGNALRVWEWVTVRLRAAGEVVPRLVMRIVMGWEFWESGLEKLHGNNWFADIQEQFPFPFNVVPADMSWGMATWFEIIGAVLLWLGLATRAVAFSLLLLTFVATAAVHWPDMISMWTDLLKGYAITDAGHGNFKLPLLFVVMLLPLIFNGAGKFSVDHLLAHRFALQTMPRPVADAWSVALAALILGVPFLVLIPMAGVVMLSIAAGAAVYSRFARP